MNAFLNDLRYAARQLASAPLFTGLAILSFGLGIGANTTLYTWAKSLLLDPFPAARHSSRLVAMNGTDKNLSATSLSYLDYLDFRRSAKSVDGLIAIRPSSVALGNADKPVRIFIEMATANYFEILGVPLAHGRGFLESEDAKPLGAPVIVLSYELWQRQFRGDPRVIGQTVPVNTHAFTIIGIAAEGFYGTRSGLAQQAWAPLMMQDWLEPGAAGRLEQRGNQFLGAFARLAPGKSVEEAQAEFSAIVASIAREHPENSAPGRGVAVSPLWRAPQTPAEIMGPIFAILAGVTLLVLLIASMNVASLLLARAMGRRREIAVRTAMGATRGRIIRQLLAESMLLAILGGAFGAVMAYFGASLLEAFIPPTDFPVRLGSRVEASALLITIGLSLVTGILFGLVPALQTSRYDTASVMREEAGSVAGTASRSRWFRRLVISQLAASTVMLVVAGLFLRSFERASNYPIGFEPRGVFLSSLELFSSGYDAERGLVFYDNLLAEAAQLPGVTSVALARRVPLGFGGSSSTTFEVEGYVQPKDGQPWGYFNVVSPAYFSTMKMPLLRGREFERTDLSATTKVAVINREMADRYWPGKEAIGGRFRLGEEWITVVGVARTAVYRDLGEKKAPWFYLPLSQRYRADMTLQLRTDGDAAALAGPVRSLAARLDPNLAVFGERTLSEHIQAAAVRQSIGGRMLSLLGVLGLVLAMVGLFGTLAFGVAQRTREMGVRMAIGGMRSDLLLMVGGEGLRLAGIGVALGLVLAVGAGQLMKGLLLGVPPWDPMTLSVVLLVLAATSLVACIVPAWRAAGTDPVKALRAE